MAHIYVDSAAVGSGTGASWANAYTTLKAACEAAGTVAGDSIWVASTHAEVSAVSVIITFKNTSAAPGSIMCVDKAGSVPPIAADLRTTATISTTGNSDFQFTGVAYFHGITFSCGTGAVVAMIWLAVTPSWQYFKNCVLKRNGTSLGTIRIGYGGPSQNVVFDNTVVGFGSLGDTIDFSGGNLLWKNTSSGITGSVFPTELIKINGGGTFTAEGVDFSALGSGKTLISSSSLGADPVVFRNCKLNNAVTLTGLPTGLAIGSRIFINCDSGSTNYRTEKYVYQGSQVVETTIVHTGGATDGVTPISWKLTTGTDSERIAPFESLPISVWNELVSTITVSVEGIWGGGATPTTTDIWLEVTYFGTSGFPLSITATTAPATVLSAGSSYAAGTGTWSGSTTKFKMSVAITPTMRGPIVVKVCAALAGSIFYIDPKIVIS